MASAVLVVDMLRGFLEPGHNLYCGDASREIIPNVRRLLGRERRAGSGVLFICDSHDPGDLEFQMFPEHCLRGTEEAEVVPELREFVGEDNLVSKNRYSAFFGTALDERLRALSPGRIIVCGVCTDICVLHTVADARNRDYAVEVPTDCVASFDTGAHQWALRHIEKILGARLVRAPQPPGTPHLNPPPQGGRKLSVRTTGTNY
jgi:nicotinamidase-related amidase